MRTTKNAARGGPLAALLFLLLLVLALPATAAERIEIEQALEWAELEDGTTGLPESVTLSLLLRGLGPDDGYPVDCMIIIDASATADLSSAKSFAFDLIDELGDDDRVGMVWYASGATLGMPLSENRLAVKTAIGDLKNGAKSALGDAMQLARRELTMVGREDALLVEVLLSDGQSNIGVEPAVEGEIAADSGIRIISIGIGSLINRSLLQSFADDTDGLFFSRPTEAALVDIMEHLDIDVVASDVTIEKPLPEGLQLASSTPRAAATTDDGVTTAIWRLSELLVGQEIEFTMEIEASEIGAWAEDMDLIVTYTDFRGVEGSQLFPPPNWPPIAEFEYEPLAATTADTLVFTDLSTDTNESGRIVKWEWTFGDEATSSAQNPEYRFDERGTYTVQLIVTDERGATSIAYEETIIVGNAAPVAGFTLRDPETLEQIERPHLGVVTMLDASMSYDLDGDIDMYRWDFDGDGVIDLSTDSSEAEYAFESPGKRDVTLIVVDDEGKTEEISKTVDVLASVVAERIIETCLPDDWTVPSNVIQVSIVLSVNTTLNGLSVSETIPAGWTFAEVDNDGAVLRHVGQTLEWLFLDKFVTDGINEQREIKYTLTAPATVDELTQANMHGVVGSSSPRVSLAIGGEDRVTVTQVLSVPVVISRWDTVNAQLDVCLQELIAFDQIQYAVSLWLSGGEVPSTGGATISLLTMQDLIAYWLTGSSVHDPLP